MKKTYIALLAAVVLLGAVAHAATKVGNAFPDIKTFSLEGKLPEDLSGKVVMVDFWASWCGPCGESFPAMEELHKKFASRGLVIIAVNEDEKKKDMEDFLKDHAVSFVVVRDAKQKLVGVADIGTMPSSFILGLDGKVAFAHSGFQGSETKKQYENEIESLLKK